MEKGTKVIVNLSLGDANKLGIAQAIDNKEGVISVLYILLNGLPNVH